MDSPSRPVEPLDILPRQVLIHAGLVFSGHLDITRLQQSAGKVVDVYPELNVCIKSTWFTVSRSLIDALSFSSFAAQGS